MKKIIGNVVDSIRDQEVPHYILAPRLAAQKVKDAMALPMPEYEEEIGSTDVFDPWREIFPALYGSYSSDFDDCALAVLRDLRDDNYGESRRDLAAEMMREMLCTQDLCDYGTSPRGCFPTLDFKELLPELIEKWEAWSEMKWGE
jgi:hypothetical protein